VLAVVVAAAACTDDETPPVEPTDNPPMIELTAPNGGGLVAPGADVEITWTASDDNGVVGVDLSYTSGGGGETIAEDLTGSSYTWTVPGNNLYAVKVRAVARDAADQEASDESDEIFGVIATSARGYVASDQCKQCHINYYNDLFNMSGHPYKLNKVTGNTAPEYPNSTVPGPPPGASRAAWSDIAYVIGGYGWKARFITKDSGWVMTDAMDGVNVQYNLPRPDLGAAVGDNWSDYHATDTERKPYDCGPCHMTGWQTFADNGGVNQDGLPGIAGTWEEPGIKCEQCHGAGGQHVASQKASDITVDGSSALCGVCHRRGTDDNFIEASGGFIRHHEQFHEWLASPHGGAMIGCNDCHDPHKGVLYGNDLAGGIVATCEDCHTGVTVTGHLPVDCENCHMARATKSAVKVHDFEGDVRTHLFAINTDGTKTKADMFFVPAGGTKQTTNPWVTLDFACYSCHTDPITQQGGGGSEQSMAELAARAVQIH
jgi:hypothetical protein